MAEVRDIIDFEDLLERRAQPLRIVAPLAGVGMEGLLAGHDRISRAVWVRSWI
jgi:hypothetical protein